MSNRTLNGRGGGVYNLGDLAIIDTAFSANQVGGSNAFGGALFTTFGQVTITNSLFSQNLAVGVDGGFASWPQNPSPSGVAQGGGLYLDSGEVILAKCSVIGNSATGGTGGNVIYPNTLISGFGGGLGSGGGIFLRRVFVTAF